MKKFLILLLLQVTVTLSNAQTETWFAPFQVYPGNVETYACESYYLALHNHQLLIHDRTKNTDRTVSFPPSANVMMRESSDALFVINGWYSNLVWLSSDQGASWDTIQLPRNANDFYAKNSTSFLFYWNDSLFRTTNGGLNWTKNHVGKNFIARFAGDHVLLMYNNETKVSHDFGQSFSTISGGGIGFSGDIDINGAIIYSFFDFGSGSKTRYTNNDGVNWQTISDAFYWNVFWVSDDKFIGDSEESSPHLLSITGSSDCQLGIKGYGGIEFPYKDVQPVGNEVCFSGFGILRTSISSLTCFENKAKSNANLSLEWAKIYQSPNADLTNIIAQVQAVSGEPVFQINAGNVGYQLLSEDKSDTLFNRNVLTFDENGNLKNRYRYANSAYLYIPKISPLGNDEGYLHSSMYPRTMLSPDSTKLYSAVTGGQIQPFSLLDKDLKYKSHFSFESNVPYFYNLDVRVLFVHQHYFMLNYRCDSTGVFIDSDGNMTPLSAGNKTIQVSNEGDLLQVFENIPGSGMALPNGEFLLTYSSNTALDTIHLVNSAIAVNNPNACKNVWIICDSSGTPKEYYLLKNPSAESLYSTNQVNNTISNLFLHRTYTSQTIYSSNGDSLNFGSDGEFVYHYLKMDSDHRFYPYTSTAPMICQQLNSDSSFLLLSGEYRIKYDINNPRHYLNSAYNDVYLGLYSDNLDLLYNIGAVGSYTDRKYFYLDYPYVYFAALIEPGKNNIPGSETYLNDYSGVVIGKFSINTNPLGLKGEEEVSLPMAYPNPTHDITHIYTLIPEETPITLDIFSIDGRLISSKKIDIHANAIDLDLSELSNGWYTIRLNGGDTQESHLILKY